MNSSMTPVDWAKRPIQKYADFTGRAPRAEYWWYVLAIVILGIVLTIIESILGLRGMVLGIYGPLTVLFWLATIVPGLAVSVRRLHDTNRSAWWLLLMVPYLLSAVMMAMAVAGGGFAAVGTAGMLGIVGLVCAIVLLVFMVLPSTPGANSYGPNPYADAGAAAVAAE